MVWSSFRALVCGLGALAPSLVACADGARFDGERAFRDLEAQVAIGERFPGSPGSLEVRALIRDRLSAAGWETEDQPFLAQPPDRAPVSMVNLVATRPGVSEDSILLAAHYDTKKIPGVRFVGANDGASGVAVLLELARALGSEPGPVTLQLVFFDGEEAFGRDINPRDGLYGSRELARRMAQSGTLERVRALILFDMVADRDLNLAVDLRSSAELRARLERLAGDLVDPSQRLRLVDDHAPFLALGMERALALIDFQYGARVSPGPFWHTARDDLDAVSADSLGRIGEIAVRMVRQLETEQDGAAAGRQGRRGPRRGPRAPDSLGGYPSGVADHPRPPARDPGRAALGIR